MIVPATTKCLAGAIPEAMSSKKLTSSSSQGVTWIPLAIKGVHVNFFSSEENVLALLQVLGRWPGVNFQVVKNIMIILMIKITMIMIIKITLIMIIIIGCEQQRADQLHKHHDHYDDHHYHHDYDHHDHRL